MLKINFHCYNYNIRHIFCQYTGFCCKILQYFMILHGFNITPVNFFTLKIYHIAVKMNEKKEGEN